MKSFFKLNRLRTFLISMSSLTLVVASGASAGPLDLSSTPLETATGVESNIMILNDDSGSMDASVLIPRSANSGGYRISIELNPTTRAVNDYAFIHEDGDNNNFLGGEPVPTENLIRIIDDLLGNLFSNEPNSISAFGVWRTRLSNFNRL